MGLISAIIAIVVGEIKKEYVIPIRICAALVICSYALKIAAGKIFTLYGEINSLTGSNEPILLLVKGTVISILTKIVCDICKESGNSGISDAVDISGRLILIVLSVPMIEAIIKTAVSFVK